jgi:hypothetical protein
VTLYRPRSQPRRQTRESTPSECECERGRACECERACECACECQLVVGAVIFLYFCRQHSRDRLSGLVGVDFVLEFIVPHIAGDGGRMDGRGTEVESRMTDDR